MKPVIIIAIAFVFIIGYIVFVLSTFPPAYILVSLIPVPFFVVGFVVLARKKKISSSVSSQSDKTPRLKTKDETQFWVCPNCGRDTQMKDGRQYCPSCKIYLSM